MFGSKRTSPKPPTKIWMRKGLISRAWKKLKAPRRIVQWLRQGVPLRLTGGEVRSSQDGPKSCPKKNGGYQVIHDLRGLNQKSASKGDRSRKKQRVLSVSGYTPWLPTGNSDTRSEKIPGRLTQRRKSASHSLTVWSQCQPVHIHTVDSMARKGNKEEVWNRNGGLYRRHTIWWSTGAVQVSRSYNIRQDFITSPAGTGRVPRFLWNTSMKEIQVPEERRKECQISFDTHSQESMDKGDWQTAVSKRSGRPNSEVSL